MDKRNIIYYTDDLNDEFSTAQIEPKKIDENYVYLHHSLFKRFTHFFWYRIIATPIAFLYVRFTFRQKTIGRKAFSKCKDSGYFMYGNHTQVVGDPFIPNIIFDEIFLVDVFKIQADIFFIRKFSNIFCFFDVT